MCTLQFKFLFAKVMLTFRHQVSIVSWPGLINYHSEMPNITIELGFAICMDNCMCVLISEL